jgi:DUF438 domain-containing protein
MEESITNNARNKALLKSLLTRLRLGMENDRLDHEIATLMGKLPNGLVVEVEQELIQDGALSVEDLTRMCDLHSRALKGVLEETSARKLNPHHP